LGGASTLIEGSNWVIHYLDEFLEETLVFAKAKTVKEKGSDLTEVVSKERKTKILFTPIKSGLTVVSGVLDTLRALPLLNLYISLTLTLLSLYTILSIYTISILLGQIKWLSKGSCWL
jgi:hypothetical protein